MFNSVQITTISEVSTKKLQDMQTVFRGIAKIAKVHPGYLLNIVEIT